MKRSIALVLFTILLVGSAQSQKFSARSYTEFTHISPKQGMMVTVQNNDGLKFGLFYQRELTKTESSLEGLALKVREKTFSGIYLAFPCINHKKANLDFGIRTGIKNGKYFSITPSIAGTYKLSKKFGVVMGISSRNLRPTLIAGFSFSLSH